MELIVKIGGDQQALQQTIDRMKTQFKTMNTSAPASWSPNLAAMQQYGGIMQSAPPASGFMSSLNQIPGIGPLAQKFGSLLGPIGLVGAALSGLALAAKGIGGAIEKAADDLRTGRVTGMSGLMAREWREAAEDAGIDSGSATGMVNRLNAQVGSYNAGDDSAKKLFASIGINPSGQSVDDLLVQLKRKIGGMTDPSERARVSKGLFGRGGFEVSELFSKLEEPGAADTEGINMAAAAGIKKWWKNVKRKTINATDSVLTSAAAIIANSRAAGWLGITPGKELGSGISGAEDTVEGNPGTSDARFNLALKEKDRLKKLGYGKQAIEQLLGEIKSYSPTPGSEGDLKQRTDIANLEAELAALTVALKDDKKAPEEKTNQPLTFQADMLAQAGLFAGSSLLFNPNFTVQQEQLDVLRRIEGNQTRNNAFSP